MAETQPKRLREESHDTQTLEYFEDDLNSINPKRQKPYNNILSILNDEDEEEEREPSHDDFSSIFTTLQQELTFDDVVSSPCMAEDKVDKTLTVDENHIESVMRHLLEASDDELGIPNVEDQDTNNKNYSHDVEINSGEKLSFDFNYENDYNCFWEVEDVDANNYYNHVVQSELFM